MIPMSCDSHVYVSNNTSARRKYNKMENGYCKYALILYFGLEFY